MKNNYNKLLALALLALASFSSHALLQTNDYFVWTYYNVTDTAPLDIGVKELSRADTVTFWNSGEPNNSSSNEHCATQTKNGGWNDLRCDNNSNRVACFNGIEWGVSNNAINLNNAANGNRPAADTACSNSLGVGYFFAAPINAEQKAALDLKIPSGNVWINAFDNTPGMGKEGVWVINRGVVSLFGASWAASQPSTSTNNRCVSVNQVGQLQAESCQTSYPLVCATQNFDDVKIVGNSTYQDLNALQAICRTQGNVPNNGQSNQWWNLAAPRTGAEVAALTATMNTAGISKAWINATGNNVGNTWQFNFGLTNWAAEEPNFGTDNEKQCAVARQSDGKWEMAKCDSSAFILCSDGAEWVVRTAAHQFTNQAFEACSRPAAANASSNPFINYSLKTPITEGDRMKAFNALRGTNNGAKAWLNLKYIADTGAWLVNENYDNLETQGRNPGVRVWYHVMADGSNAAEYGNDDTKFFDYWKGTQTVTKGEAKSNNLSVPNYFAHQEPNGSDKSTRDSCVQLSTIDQSWGKAGQWDDTSCGNSKRAACYDGFEWAVSAGAVALGSNVEATENLSTAHNACAAIEKNGIAGNFRFAAPTSFKESMELAATASAMGVSEVWINVNSKKYKRTFIMNLGARVQAPFWNTNEPNNAGSGEDCATQQRDATLGVGWNDLSCATSLPVACYNPNQGVNGTWQVTTTNHTFASALALNKVCETTFGSQYKFYAPATLSQQAALKAVMGSNTEVYINANDIAYEGSWQINLDINNWAAGQPSTNAAELCVSANTSTSFWSSRACNEQLPVACSSGARWYFTKEKATLSQFANAEKLCQKEFGSGYFFAAPRTLDDAQQLQHSAKLEGLGGHFWINGNRIENFNEWVWNANRLSTPVWGYNGQPDGGKAENCAVLNNNSEGSWDDENCATQTFAYLCRNGNQWQVTGSGTLADFATAVTACAALGADWVFAAPTTYNENLAAKNAMGSHTKVWVNATDAVNEGDWLLNAAPIKEYPLWGDTTTGSCLFQDDQGKVGSTDCAAAVTAPWACNNGYIWKVTKSEGSISKFAAGHKACLREYGSEYMFAAPLSMNDAIQLDFARLQAAHDRNNGINRVWINMTTAAASPLTSHNGVSYRRNLPFANWRDFSAGEEPLPTLCAYKGSAAEGMDNPWLTQSCSNFAAHYACTDGNTWKVALSKGKLEGDQVQLVPQLGQDYWSSERGNTLCKEQYGPSYYFSAPISAADELALDAAIRRSPANVKIVWLNYYAISALAGEFLSYYAPGDINRGDGLWFANRLKLGTWQKPNFGNFNNANCALLHSDGSLTDTSCSNDSRLDFNQETYPFACFNGIEWTVVGNGYWENGFAACESASNTMFGVPRTPDELEDLRLVMSAAGHSKIWLNLNDTAQEGQWIANRLRYSWWAADEPSNTFNKDCAQASAVDGKWFAARCTLEIASFACRSTTSGSSGATTAWHITAAKGYWAEGFGACAKEFPNSQFVAPQGFGTSSGSEDQAALYAELSNPSNGSARNAWLNLSDQETEGAWRGYHAYSNWGVNSLFDQTKDCGYIDIAVPVQPGKGNWFADSCKYTAGTPLKRGYSCTNGSVWQIVGTDASTDMRWSSGFAACQSLGASWYFAAPTTGIHNTQLQNAMKDKGITQLWINAHDRINEGDWLINGKEINFPPEANVSATATVVNENTANIQLYAALSDEEEQGINTDTAITRWEIVSNRSVNAPVNAPDFTDITVSNIAVTPTANGGATVTATYSTPVLFKEDRLLTFKLTATDVGSGTSLPATSEIYVNVRVRAPLLAAWDFEDSSRPHLDITGHGHDILVSSMSSASLKNEVTNGSPNRAALLNPASQLKVNGIEADAENGLDFSPTAYTIALRISIEAGHNAKWRGIIQKGDEGNQRQPGLFLFNDSDILHSTNSTDVSDNRAANSAAEMLPQQWLNMVYVKTANNFKVYVDGVLTTQYDFVGAETSKANTGSFYIGHIPGAEESFTGLIDDIYVFNRELTPTEMNDVLPAKPLGTVQFKEASTIIDEANTTAPHTYIIELERTRGNAEALTVYVDHVLAGSTASKGTMAEMAVASNAPDFAFTDEASYVTSQGIPVTWAAGERGIKTLSITLDKEDDGDREGTETALFKITDTAGANLGSNGVFTLYLKDLTPNPYGAFSVGVKSGANYLPEKRVIETDPTPQEICFVRDIGTAPAALGATEIRYTVEGTAVVDTDYTVGGGLALGAPIIYAAGEHGERCFTIVAMDNTAVKADHNIKLTIDSVSSDDPVVEDEIVLTAGLTSANLVIQDYNPGVFGFKDSKFHCYENVDTAQADVDNIVSWARPQSSTCEITVKRSGTGNSAPAAEIKLQLSGNNIYGLSTDFDLVWPALDAANPATAETEEQKTTLTIPYDNKQNSDAVYILTLEPVAGVGGELPKIDAAGINTATLHVQDVTGPAVVSVGVKSGSPATLNEGTSTEFEIKRSGGNPNTYFDIDYQVVVENSVTNEVVNNPEHYISSPLTGTYVFAKADTSKTFTLNTVDTVENNADIKVNFNLVNPRRPNTDVRPTGLARDDVVGLGTITAAGTGVDNTAGANVLVQNTRDLIANNMSVVVRDLGGDSAARPIQTFNAASGSTVNAGNFFAVKKAQVPDTRELELEIQLPAGKHIDDATYSWSLLNPDGSEAQWDDGVTPVANTNGNTRITNRSGSLGYESTGLNKTNALSIKANVKLPFALSSPAMKLVLNIQGNNESLTKTINLQVDMLWRKLQQNGNECYRARSTSDSLAPCGNVGQYFDLYYAWNSEAQRLVNRQAYLDNSANKCAALGGAGFLSGSDSWLTTCGTGNDRTFTFHTSEPSIKVDGTGMCRSGWAGQDLIRTGCSGNDGKWAWKD